LSSGVRQTGKGSVLPRFIRLLRQKYRKTQQNHRAIKVG
jgi:hypothetical protein